MAEPVAIKPVESKKALLRFIKFPWQVYRGATRDDNWVPPLLVDEKALFDPAKHPFHKHADLRCFLAFRGDELVGRIAAIIDYQYIKSRNENTGYFGFFECFNDREVAPTLFEAAADWLREKEMTKIIGPISPTPNHILGLLINNFDTPPVLQTPYNPPYYVDLYEQWGLEKQEDHFAYYLHKDTLPLSEKVIRVNKLARKRGNITFRAINMKNFKDEVEIIREIWNDAWRNNIDHVPWTKEEFLHMAKDLRLIANTELVLLAFVKGEPAGFSIPLPNINETLIKMNGRLLPFGIFRLLYGKRHCKLLRLAILGVRPQFQNMGIDSIFIFEVYRRGVELGYEAAELSLIVENNYKLINLLDSWGADRYKTFRVYQKSI